MFIALEVSLSVISALRPIVARIRRVDRGLAEQLTDAASSSALNVSEGSKRTGKDQAHHYRIAAGSCAESKTSVRTAGAWGYLDGLDTEVATAWDLLDRQAALLHRLVHPRR